MVLNAVDSDDKTPKRSGIHTVCLFEDAKRDFEINQSYMECQLMKHNDKFAIEEICKRGN